MQMFIYSLSSLVFSLSFCVFFFWVHMWAGPAAWLFLHLSMTVHAAKCEPYSPACLANSWFFGPEGRPGISDASPPPPPSPAPPPVWNLRAVIWFHFSICFLVLPIVLLPFFLSPCPCTSGIVTCVDEQTCVMLKRVRSSGMMVTLCGWLGCKPNQNTRG